MNDDLIFDAAAQGWKGLKYTVLMVLLFALPNLGCIIAGVVSFFKTGADGLSLLWFLLILVSGAGFSVLSFYLTYLYLMVDSLRISYDYLRPFFRAICGGLSGQITAGSQGFLKKGYDWASDIVRTFQDVYHQKIPGLIRRVVRFVLEQIPFADMAYHVSLDTDTNDSQKIADSLYSQVDGYITKKFFEGNSLKWVFWLFPLNGVVQFVLLRLIF